VGQDPSTVGSSQIVVCYMSWTFGVGGREEQKGTVSPSIAKFRSYECDVNIRRIVT
jgi:hypothetical protein